jgi:hypothetical protein
LALVGGSGFPEGYLAHAGRDAELVLELDGVEHVEFQSELKLGE